jgi:hypothetical protein
MSLTENGGGETSFVLLDKSPGQDTALVCDATSVEMKSNWIKSINAILDMQNQLVIILSNPMAHQNLLSKENSAPEIGGASGNNTSCNTGALRKTQSQPAKSQCNTTKKNNRKTSSEDKKADSKDNKDNKHSRAKSVPSPTDVNAVHVSNTKDSTTEKLKKSSDGGSPKPKRGLFDGFKHTLRSKKSNSSSSSNSSNNHCRGNSRDAKSASVSAKTEGVVVAAAKSHDEGSRVDTGGDSEDFSGMCIQTATLSLGSENSSSIETPISSSVTAS